MRTTSKLLVAAALSATLTLAACGGPASKTQNGAPGEIDRNGTLRVAMSYPTYPLDPHTPGSPTAAYPYDSLLYDRLTQMGPELKLEPMLAKEWKFADDSRSATFTLRDDVTFSDGEKLDAEAVKLSLDRALNLPKSTVAGYLAMIESVEVVDAQTIKIYTNRPADDLPYILSGTEGSIISPKAIDNPDLDVKPVGSGPYTLDKIQIGQNASFERRSGYWDPKAAPAKRIEMVNVASDNTRLNALRSGEYDLAMTKLNSLKQFDALGDEFTTKLYPAATTYSIALNTDRPNIDNKLVRQALNWAIDREAINDSLLNGKCEPIAQPLTKAYAGHLSDPSVDYTYDPGKARKLLAEAGVPDGFSIKVLVPAEIYPEQNIAEAVQAQLAEVGVKVELAIQAGAQAYPNWAPGTKYEGFVNVKPTQPTAAMTLESMFLVKSRYPGSLPDGFANTLKKAFDPKLDENQRTATLETVSELAVSTAMDVPICAVPTIMTFADNVIGADDMARSYFMGIPELRYVGVAKG